MVVSNDELHIILKRRNLRAFEFFTISYSTILNSVIELHSHDPLRYVGDMAAWLHQCAATERENLNQLVKKCPEHLVAPHKRDMMQKILEGVCRPLKLRIEQILVAEPGPVILYKLSNLLQFYHQTIKQIIQAGAGAETAKTENTNTEKFTQHDLLETLEVTQFFQSFLKKFFENFQIYFLKKFYDRLLENDFWKFFDGFFEKTFYRKFSDRFFENVF